MSQLTEFFDSMHGVIFPFAGSTAPSGFLMCDGAAASRTDCATLFAVIGSAYGDGDGVSTFNVPDLRGRVPAGRDDMGGVAAGRLTAASAAGIDGTALGAAGGEQAHTLTAAQMPSHSHGSGSLAASSGGAHTHTIDYGSAVNNGPALQIANETNQTNFTKNTGSAGAHGHTITGSTTSVGSGSAHNNVQPTLVTNFIIKI